VLVKRAIFLLNSAFAISILDLISQVHLPSFVNMLLKYLKDSTLLLVYHNFYGAMILEMNDKLPHTNIHRQM